MRRTNRGLLVAAAGLALLLLAPPPAPAQQTRTVCTEPLTPYCVDREIGLDDDAAVKRCQTEVDRYVERMEEYVTCLGELRAEARERATQVKERFACVEGDTADCP